MFRGRPQQGYPLGAPWRDGWCYRLVTPRIPVESGEAVVVHYDAYDCALDYTCDYTDTKVRFFDSDYNEWCPWDEAYWALIPGCFWWNFDTEVDLSSFTMIQRTPCNSGGIL